MYCVEYLSFSVKQLRANMYTSLIRIARCAMQVVPLPINISTTSNVLAITNRMPLATVYVLGTILQVGLGLSIPFGKSWIR